MNWIYFNYLLFICYLMWEVALQVELRENINWNLLLKMFEVKLKVIDYSLWFDSASEPPFGGKHPQWSVYCDVKPSSIWNWFSIYY